MRPRRNAPKLNGWLIVDKPAGMTSTAVVNRVRALTQGAKAGHAGTLDPLATGVLPVAFGEATKTVAYAMDGLKTYQFRVRWGEARATDDADGAVSETCEARPEAAAIRQALGAFQGVIAQVPPAYSAIKVAGERAYDLARADRPAILAARPVTIHRFDLVAIVDRDHADFEVVAGKGAYMRSLARDLARALGTCGHIAVLRRTAVGAFRECDAILIETLGGAGEDTGVAHKLLPVETALADIPALAVTGSEAAHLRSGEAVHLFRTMDLDRIRDLADGAMVCAKAGNKPVALARLEGGRLHPVRILNL
ncbi:MAG: tRNA pseudouridine(55) synthase TruB [Alphaproteobacteria bacterium]|nr:tRNA pseudouridine(55) synthase TruB [Alphaproteobacteria bacterium]